MICLLWRTGQREVNSVKFKFVVNLLLLSFLLATGQSMADDKPWLGDNRLYSILWYSTSPEREALCQQTFAIAMESIDRKLAQKRSGNPLAIVVEIDEVLLDSTGYVTFLLLNDEGYENVSWDEWVRFQSLPDVPVQLVPGSLEFLTEIESKGLSILYLSDRQAEHFEGTYQTLKDLGLSTKNLKQRILLTSDSDWAIVDNANKKYARQVEVMKDYDVLAWLGSQIEDFPVRVSPKASYGQALIDERREAFLGFKKRLGKDFFLFPNPIWGTWLNSLGELKNSDELLDDFGFGKFYRKRRR